MSAAATDLFRTRDHVADFDSYVTAYTSRSEQSRAHHDCRLDLAYGDHPGERLDLFLPPGAAAGRPVHMFIHGGYWRMFDKADFSFVADTVVAAGGIAAIINYALMPAVRMQTIVGQVRRAASWLHANAPLFGGDPTRLSVSGHSAGAHLCCWLLDAASPVAPRGGLLLSGIYDLAPLRHSFLQPMLELTTDEVRQFSPVGTTYRSGANVNLIVGATETEPFHSQAQAMATHLKSWGVTSTTRSIPSGNHMRVALDLGDSKSIVGRALTEIIALDSADL